MSAFSRVAWCVHVANRARSSTHPLTAHVQAIGVLPGAGNKGVTLVTKKKAAANKPAKALTTSAIKRSGVRAIAKTVRGLAAKSHYRPDLQKVSFWNR